MNNDTSTITIYKLLTKDRTSFSGCRWTPGEWKETSGEGALCGPGWLHAYIHPLLALLHNPIHGDYREPVLWWAEARGRRLDDGQMKSGFTKMRILESISLPRISIQQRIRYAIYCAWAVSDGKSARSPVWRTWAQGWVQGQDRSAEAAAVAEAVATDARAAVKVGTTAAAIIAREQWAALKAQGAAAEAASVLARVQSTALPADSPVEAQSPAKLGAWSTEWTELQWAALEALWESAEMRWATLWVVRCVATTAQQASIAGRPLDLVQAAQWAMSKSITLP